MNNRQKKKQYCNQRGYNPSEEKRIQQLIGETIRYTEQRLIEAIQESMHYIGNDQRTEGYAEAAASRIREKMGQLKMEDICVMI